MSDLISRRQAIDALECQIKQCNKALSNFGISMIDEYAVKVERASLVAYEEQLKCLPSVQPEETIPVSWIEAIIERFMMSGDAFSGLTASIIRVMLNE